MKWKESHEWVKSKIEENGLDLDDKQKVLQLLDHLDKEYPENMKKAREYATYLDIKHKVIAAFLYLRYIVKLPIYLLSIIIIGFCIAFNLYNIRTIIDNLLNKKYTKEQTDKMILVYEHYTNHAAAIFYILFFAWLILKK